MYKACLEAGLSDLWGHLWAKWSRPGGWELWARSARASVSRLRATMGAEASFQRLKSDDLNRSRVADLAAFINALSTRTISR